MPDAWAGNHLHVGSVKVGVLYVVEESITPVDAVCQVIDGEAVWPAKQHVTEHHHVGTVQEGAADVRRTVPLREEHEPDRNSQRTSM